MVIIKNHYIMRNATVSQINNRPAINNISDIQKMFENITGHSDINVAFSELIKDYIHSKEFQLKVQNAQYEIKWGLTYNEFEKESAKWENGSSYEIEQEYYNWGEIISELQHFKNLALQWI